MRAWVGQDEYVSGRFHANSALFNQLPLHLVHGDYQPYQNLESVISVLLSLKRLFLVFGLNILFINMSGLQGLKSTSRITKWKKQDTSRRIQNIRYIKTLYVILMHKYSHFFATFSLNLCCLYVNLLSLFIII